MKKYRLFILSAGKGIRLWPLTKDNPKSLVKLSDDSCILERQLLSAIESKVIDEVFIITGYLHDKIEAFIKKYEERIKIETIFNPFYDMSNNLHSLWTSIYHMKEKDFIITNGDNIYLTDVFEKVVTTIGDTIQVTIDYKDTYDFDDMKVSFDEKKITRIHKDIDMKDVKAESVGLCLVRGEEKRREFVNEIESLVKEKEYLKKFWLEIFNSMISKGNKVDYFIINPDEWQEIDFHPDMETVKKIFATKI